MPRTRVFANKADLTAALNDGNILEIAHWDVSRVTDMSGLFDNLQSFNADISSWDTSGVTTMAGMFYVRAPPRALPPICSPALPCTLRAAAVVHRLLPPTRIPHPAPHVPFF